jgi:hypothetical protein
MVVRSEKARLHEHSVGNAIRVQYLDVFFGSCVIIGRITAYICKREVRMAFNSGHYPERLTCDRAPTRRGDSIEPRGERNPRPA